MTERPERLGSSWATDEARSSWRSGRTAAREGALLALFAAHGDEAGGDEALAALWALLGGDDEVLAELVTDPAVYPGQEVAPAARVLARARGLLSSDPERRAFVERLVRGTLSHLGAIDDFIARCSLNWKVSRMARVDLNLLRLAAYELVFEPDIPNKVTLNEAIEIAKRYGSEDSGAFVNGILDRIAQELEAG